MSFSRSLRGAFRAGAWTLLLLIPALPSSAQVLGDRSTERSTAVANPLEELRKRAVTSSFTGSLAPLEGAVDPKTYLVGPGDVFAITIDSGEGTAASVPVSADGVLLLPNAGSVPVAGLTLEVARERALASLKRSFGQTPVDLGLAQPRQFYVHVSGAVPLPGRYLALPVSRVSSVLEIAFADTSRSAVTNPAFRPSLRNVTVIRRSGDESSVDLHRYFAAGDVSQNPYLTDGDVIVVPGYDPAYESVHVDGAVPFPGAYDFRDGDTVRDLLAVAGALSAPSHATTVRLTHITPGGATATTEFPAADAFGSGSARLSPRDHIALVADHPAGGSASIEGWVRSAGSFAIDQGTTTVRDLVERAGGLRSGALLTAAYIERNPMSKAGAAATSAGAAAGSVSDLVELLRGDTLRAARSMRLTDLDFMSRQYFLQDFRMQQRVSVDLEAALAGLGEQVLLRDGDRLVIPRDEKTVYVFGQVVRPGYVAFTPGKTREWYVRAAGGNSPEAGEVVLVRAGTGEVAEQDLAEVMSGDVVFVDRRVDLADSPVMQQIEIARQQIDLQERNLRREQKFRIIQTVLGTVSTIGTVVALILSIQRQ